jgi:TRAP-type C4-dicarboxylate transport system permease small subunit
MTPDDVAMLDTEVPAGTMTNHISGPAYKWPALDIAERVLTAVCGAILVAFTLGVLLDVVTRQLGHPVNGLQNFILGSFVWGVFLGAAVGHRRGEHFRLAALAERFGGMRRKLFATLEHGVVMAVAFWMIWFGVQNVQSGMRNYLQPTEVPLAAVTAAIPVSALLIGLFSFERLFHVWTGPADPAPEGASNA